MMPRSMNVSMHQSSHRQLHRLFSVYQKRILTMEISIQMVTFILGSIRSMQYRAEHSFSQHQLKVDLPRGKTNKRSSIAIYDEAEAKW